MRSAGVFLLSVLVLLIGCHEQPTPTRARRVVEEPVSEAAGRTIDLRGRFVKFTNWPCHRSDPFVGNETVVFHGSDGSDTAIVTSSANWYGRPADPPLAPLGQCEQVAPFRASLPVADRYDVEINDHHLPPVSLQALRSAGFRWRFVLPA